jgi:hypothetical protein
MFKCLSPAELPMSHLPKLIFLALSALAAIWSDWNYTVGASPTTPHTQVTSTDDCQSLLPPGLQFPDVGPTLPFDAQFNQQPTLDDVQKGFDLFSWASFVALNWPANADGTPMGGTIGDHAQAPRIWETYATASMVFKPDGSTPDPWGATDTTLAKRVAHYHPGERVMVAWSKNVLNDVNQAGFGEGLLPPIADLNSNYVFYEIQLNKIEYDYLLTFKLYNKQGQIDFLRGTVPPNTVSFPSGTTPSHAYGASEIKAAWKQVGPGDNPARFYTIRATRVDPVTQQASPDVQFALVGLHIVTRTASAPFWVWSTFEHVDNCPDVGAPALAAHYSFNNLSAQQQPASGYVNKPNDPKPQANPLPTQITRVLNNELINHEWTRCLNTTMQARLFRTVWTNYRLVTTQWPNGRHFIPAQLTNTVAETYIQNSQVTGSCMNCHKDAKTAGTDTSGRKGDANFSYLLQMAR